MQKLKNKIRIGILLNSFTMPAWLYLSLEKITKSYYAEIDLLIYDKTIKKTRKNFLIDLNFNIEKILFRIDPNAFENKNSEDLLSNIPRIITTSKIKNTANYFEYSDIEKIKQYDLDVIVSINHEKLEGDIVNIPKYGIWTYSKKNFSYDGYEGFWEVLTQNPITMTNLRIIDSNNFYDKILVSSYSATDPYSIIRNRNNSYWKSSAFLPRKLKQLYDYGENSFFQNISRSNLKTDEDTRLYNTGSMVKGVLQNLTKYFRSTISNLIYDDQWTLFYKFENSISFNFSDFKKILSPGDRYWADPCVIHVDDSYFIFIEEFLFKSSKGHISVFTIDKNKKPSVPVRIIDESYHLSYPHVFKFDNCYYMIPESAANRKIDLYKCEQFPNKWKFHKTLMNNVNAVDSTTFYFKNKWWIFTGITENHGASSSDELFLFHSDDLFSNDWIAHPQNPIVSDIRRARSAGKIFYHEGKILRPSQNSSKRYGYGLVFNEIITLNEHEYCEKEIYNISPYWDKKIRGMHTFDHLDGLTFIDGRLRR